MKKIARMWLVVVLAVSLLAGATAWAAAGPENSASGQQQNCAANAACVPTGVASLPWPAPLRGPFKGQWIWQFADGPANTWMAFRKTVTLSQVMYYMALDGAVRMAELLAGHPRSGAGPDAEGYRTMMSELKSAFIKEFWDGTRLASRGFQGADDRASGKFTVKAQLGPKRGPSPNERQPTPARTFASQRRATCFAHLS